MLLFFKGLTIIGFLLSFADFIGQVAHSPICRANGCLLVNQLTRYGSIPFTIAGIILFSFLFLASFRKQLSIFIDFILPLAFVSEGMLIGYQAFFLQSFCVVCVAIALVIAALVVVRFRHSEQQPIAIFSLIACILLFVVSLFLYIPYSPGWIPQFGQTIVYSGQCPHCENLIAKLKAKHIKIRLVRVVQAKKYLAANGIDVVPVLIKREKESTKIIVGETKIGYELFPLAKLKNNSFPDILSTDRNSGSCNIGEVKCK